MKKAIEFQTKSIEILKTILSPEDNILKSAQHFLFNFQQNLNDKKKTQSGGGANNRKIILKNFSNCN
jgi:hypothetical protein